MNPVYDFTGQVALVTGASSGIGLAAAKAFAEAGAAVVLADINTDALRAATEELTSAGHQAIGVTCDVADEAQAAAMVQRTVATYRSVGHGVQQCRHRRFHRRPGRGVGRELRPGDRDQPARYLDLHEA